MKAKKDLNHNNKVCPIYQLLSRVTFRIILISQIFYQNLHIILSHLCGPKMMTFSTVVHFTSTCYELISHFYALYNLVHSYPKLSNDASIESMHRSLESR